MGSYGRVSKSTSTSVILLIFQTVIVPIFLVIFVGYAFQRLGAIETKAVSDVVLHILTPCLVFTSITGASWAGGDWLKVSALAAATTFTLIILSWIIARAIHLNRELAVAFVLSTSFMNAGNFGLPLSLLAFGDKGLGFAVVFFVATAILMFTVGAFVACSSRGGFKQALANLIRLPLIYALVAAVLVKIIGLSPPQFVMQAANLMSQAAIPTMLVLLGMDLASSGIQWSNSARWRLVTLSAGLKLLFPVLFVSVAADLIGLVGLSAKITVLQASMPTAVFVTLLTLKFGGDSSFATSVILLSTLISIGTLTLLLFFMI